MGKLIIVSNRVAPPDEEGVPGGLASGLRAALRECGGIWFGWSGRVTPEADDEITHSSDGATDFLLVNLCEEEHRNYYIDFSNRTLWPLCHYRPSLLDYDRDAFIGYCGVNQRFARLLSPLIEDDDLVWIHDYHLIPLGRCLRELGVVARLGFFLHVPMPPPSLLTLLPHHESLFSAFSSYDLVGLQTDEDAESLRSYLRDEMGAVDTAGLLRFPGGGRCRVRAFPIGVDPESIASQAQEAIAREDVRRLDRSLEGRKLVIGVDRLDYSKGLPHRFKAFASFLDRHQEWRSRVSYLQIAPLSREDVPEYRELQQQLEHLAGATNGHYADPHWAPIRYVNRAFDQTVLAGYYRTADVALVTPLRDGMNLVAKEFVAAQSAEDPGVLILSCFAGAARELHEGAVTINPIDPEDIVESLHRALAMPLSERRARWRDLHEKICGNTIHHWRAVFLDALRRVSPRPGDEPRGDIFETVPDRGFASVPWKHSPNTGDCGRRFQ